MKPKTATEPPSSGDTESLTSSGNSRLDKHNRVTFSVNSSCSATTSVSHSASPSQENVGSVPSLVRQFDVGIASRRKNNSKPAFTTDELQISKKWNKIDPTRASSQPPTQPSSKQRRKYDRHGVMSANSVISAQAQGFTRPAHKSISLMNQNDKKNDQPIRARPTVTTILRQQHVLERAEKKEREKLDSLLVSNAVLFESESVIKEKERRDVEEAKAAEAKRLLQAKLAYERARAASRKVADEKQRIAESTRQKEREWQMLLAEQKEADIIQRKSKTGQVQKSFSDSKQAFNDMLRMKQIKAAQMKVEFEQLQQEAREKERQADIKRQDRIQQIQASKIALKKTKESMGNPNQFYRSIAIPEIQIKLRLQKEEEKRNLEQARRKIQAAKQTKSVKLIRAMRKIQSFESLSKKQSAESDTLKEKIQSNPFLIGGASSDQVELKGHDEKVNEIEGMLQELTLLKEQNYLQKRADEQYQKVRVFGTIHHPVKVIRASNIISRGNLANSRSSAFNHNTDRPTPSHYGTTFGI